MIAARWGDGDDYRWTPGECCAEFAVPKGWRELRTPGQVHPDHRPVTNPDEATAITSTVAGSGGAWHRPVLDIDFPAVLVPSTTPGHSHLLIDRDLTWTHYAGLIRALAVGQVIDRGWARISLEQGYTAVRTAWAPKARPA